MFVTRDYHRRPGFPNIPYSYRTVTGSRGENIGVFGVPRDGVHAIRMLPKSAEGSGAVEGPELNGIVPGSREERVAARWVVIETVDFTGVFFEGAERVGVRREGGVVYFDRAIGDGGDEDGVVRFGPRDVVDTIGGVVGD